MLPDDTSERKIRVRYNSWTENKQTRHGKYRVLTTRAANDMVDFQGKLMVNDYPNAVAEKDSFQSQHQSLELAARVGLERARTHTR